MTPRLIGATLAAALLCAVAGPSAAEKDWWAIAPLSRPAVPAVPGVRNPVDAFVRATLAAKKLAPAPEADRRTLIRRLTYDLTGLPPTPDEIAAFLDDHRPDAYERLVDRLLASPAYGERFARKWMDAVHFAETHGHDQDRVREHAWPYRDYLVAAFNDDRPYGRFVREQVAGDHLYPDDAAVMPALGLLAAGPWDESSLRDIREDTLDRQIGRYLDRDDILTTVMGTFTSTTVHCARCHDHKFDPISIKDYYALQAVFAGADRGNRTYDADPAVARRRAELRKKREATIDRKELAAFLATWRAAEGRWRPLMPEKYASANGATLTRGDDGSVLSGGKRPETDTVTLEAASPLERVTAVRLEVLTDPSLPKQGPGRQENGNLHLSEVAISIQRGGKAERVAIAGPTADFDQAGWTIRHAVDGNPRTAWGIYPEVGRPHAAVLPFKSPARLAKGDRLVVVLKQLHGGGHLIGRARLSVTDADPVPFATAGDPAKWGEVEYRRFHERKVDAELAALPPPGMVYAAGGDFIPDGGHRPAGTPREVRVLKRGQITSPGAVALPGAYRVVPVKFTPVGDGDGARRAALANWLTHPENAIVWRSIANRVWGWHFGRGLVDTPNDFGQMGSRPTHPELLDWLAVELRDGGQSLKALHRLIVTSATYRQSGKVSPGDPENRLLTRFARQRLDAEQVRDAVLLASGRLDRRMGGPSERQFALRPGVHVTPVVDYSAFDVNEGRRRSVYRFLFRTLPDPLMEALDCPAGDQLTPQRTNGVTVQQALAMWNSAFVLRHAEHFAARLEGLPVREQARLACLWCWGREPTEDEGRALAAHGAKHGLAAVCRVLFNSNEFVFVP